MPKIGDRDDPLRALDLLELDSCPTCGASHPLLVRHGNPFTGRSTMGDKTWSLYTCRSCSGFVVAGHLNDSNTFSVREVYPAAKSVPTELPPRARAYLEQALASKRQPSASVVVAASAIDEMLRAVGFAEGTLNASIRKAADAHTLTPEMVAWAHHVRLEANGQRHPKPDEPLPTVADAEQVIEFALALGEYLFVLPSRVKKGLAAKTTATP